MSLSEELGIEVTSTKELFPGVEIWECTRDQANAIARQHGSQAWRIWLIEEVDKYILADPEELLAIIEKKKQKPGPYLK